MPKPILILSAIALVLSSCLYNNEEELYPDEAGCQTDDVSYSADVLPILQTNCYRCHDAKTHEANITLEGYANVKVYADNGSLLGAISWDSGFSPMPQDAGKLNDCLISQIESWINSGAPDN